jgi:hypothetical protein
MISLSDRWASRLISQPETGMGYQIVTLVLKDGRRFDQVTIVGGTITKIDGHSLAPFKDEDIADIVVTHGRKSS